MELKEPAQLTLSTETVTTSQESGNTTERLMDSLREMLFALKAAKSEFLDIRRNAQNPYLGNRYATLGQVLEAVEPALAKHDFIIEHRLVYRDSKTYLVTSILHIPTLQDLTTEVELSYRAGDMQSLGSAITYARRYSLLVLLGLSMEDDDGNKAKEDGGDELKSKNKQVTTRNGNTSGGNAVSNNPFQRR